MLIANESQWRTEDLTALTKRIMDDSEFSKENFYSETLLLFKTSRKKTRKSTNRYGDETEEVPDAASYDGYTRRYYDTRLILIRSVDKLQMDVLDRLANSDVRQDMSQADMKVLAKCIARAVGGYRSESIKLDFIKDMPMRVGGQPKRSALAQEREIQAIRNEQGSVRRRAAKIIEQMEKKIDKVRSRKTVD